MCKFEEEIRLTKEEIAIWTEGKRSSVQLEGIDKYLQQEKQQENSVILAKEKLISQD